MEYIRIGKIIKTHGIKGEVKIYPLTDNIYRFDDLNTVYLGHGKNKVIIETVRYHKDLVLLKFKDFSNINEVLPYKGEYLYIDAEDRVALSEDQFFLSDIIGAVVYTKEDRKVGRVCQIIQSAGNDVYVIQDDQKKREYMIPAVKEFVISVDIDNKRIIIDPIEGMI